MGITYFLMEYMMKILRSAVVVLAIGAASISSASARDSFNIGINIGGQGYYEPYPYYAAPPVVYYSEPVVYYRQAPSVYYYAPVVSYGYQHYGNQSGYRDNHWDNHWGNNGHHGHGHHGGHH